MKRENEYSFLLSTRMHEAWKRVGIKKRIGVVAPLFSIHSKKSLGIGEFDDLKLLIDWCVENKNSIIQLLPLNEVGPLYCPYDSISSFALEPAYISLRLLKGSCDKTIAEKIAKLRRRFAIKERIDYGIKSEKLRLLWEIFCLESDSLSQDFARFVSDNSFWIYDFALYKVLKEFHQGKPWYQWPDAFKHRQEASLKAFSKAHQKAILYHQWVQWNLAMQFKSAKAYALSRRIFLKGDLPVLVSRDSADVWSHQDFFKLDYAAGAPPDMYCAKGQRWGMPTYNWPAIRADGYRYLKEKLRFAQNFYDLLRIDHVVGLFRIWSIPVDNAWELEGLHGFFDPHDEKEWGRQGKEILSVIIENTNMLICAEDLGVIPKVCTETLREFGIPGNDVQRWVKDWEKRHDFLGPEEYRPASVAMLSTHDTTNWPAWWEQEAGTIDEALFIRKCQDRGIDHQAAKARLFNMRLSQAGRLRWSEKIDSIDCLISILGKRRDELKDFIEMYENTYGEKEKLWKHLRLKGAMREKCDRRILSAVMSMILGSKAIFSINLITDYLFLLDMIKADPAGYRINRPGTISDDNWSLIMPVSLEEML